MRHLIRATLVVLLVAAIGGTAWFLTGRSSQAQRRAPAPEGVAVVTAVARSEDVPIRKRAIGFVESPAMVAIRSRIESQIVEQHVREGQNVHKDDLLFVLDDRDLRAQLARDEATLARDRALSARAQADLSRAQQLVARNAGTQQAVDLATADAHSAAATVEADQAAIAADQLRLGYARISAPMDGRVGVVPVAPGNLVSAGAGVTLATITQMAPLRVVFTLPERELPNLRALISSPTPPVVRAHIPGSDAAPPSGTLTFLDSSVDTQSGTVTVKATFPNTDLALWPGQYVDVELDAGLIAGAVAVPATAVQQGQNGTYLYVVRSDSTVELRNVTVAIVEGDRAAIQTGLSAGERVVIEGQLRLRNRIAVRDTPAQQPAAPTPPAPQSSSNLQAERTP